MTTKRITFVIENDLDTIPMETWLPTIRRGLTVERVEELAEPHTQRFVVETTDPNFPLHSEHLQMALNRAARNEHYFSPDRTFKVIEEVLDADD